MQSEGVGDYQIQRHGEFVRCPWHGWEFDMRTGQSYFDPVHTKARSYPVIITPGGELAEGPYVAETFPVTVDESYVLVDV